MSRAVTAGYITVQLQNSAEALVKAAANREKPAIVSQTTPYGATGLTLSGVVDDAIEVMADNLKIADA